MSPNDRGLTTFNVDLAQVSNVVLEVLNAAGKRLWATQLLDAAPGHHTILFDGRDHRGRPLRGTYFYRISANGSTVTRKMSAATATGLHAFSRPFATVFAAAQRHGYRRVRRPGKNENGRETNRPARFALLSPRRWSI